MKRAKVHLKPRNPFAHSPLLRKGAAHGRTRGSLRRRDKAALQKESRDTQGSEER